MLSNILLVFLCTGICPIPNNRHTEDKISVMCEERVIAVHEYKNRKFLLECSEGFITVTRGVLV